MFIIDEPYVSGLALKTLATMRAPVFRNAFAASFKDVALNLVDEIEPGGKIYSNSENAIALVLERLPDSPFTAQVKACKDKYEFRRRLQAVYPDFRFQRLAPEDFDAATDLPERFVIKPAVGFLSMGVHKVESQDDWEKTKASLRAEIKDFRRNFPESVLSPSAFIVEELIEGEEFAVDVYFDGAGRPVILNIFRHPFAGKDDVSDRLYVTSKAIIERNLDAFAAALANIGQALYLKDFPAHIEVIRENSGSVVPVEINPMRFAGWCTTDLAYFAYGIDVYKYFHYGLKPDWKAILKDKGNETYYFALAETPPDIDKARIDFDHEAFKRNFSHILDYRPIDYRTKPLFAIVFGRLNTQDEIAGILGLKTKDFIYPLKFQ